MSDHVLDDLAEAHARETAARADVDRFLLEAARLKIPWVQIARVMDVGPEVVRMRVKRMVNGHRVKFPAPQSDRRAT
jgi:hypothetical protein